MHSSLRNYTPLLKILEEFKKQEESVVAVWMMNQAGNGSESTGKLRARPRVWDLDHELVGLTSSVLGLGATLRVLLC